MGATLIQLIPLSELAPGQIGAIRNSIIDKMVSDAVVLLKLTADKLLVRDIRVKEDLVVYSAGSDADVEDWGGLTGTTANAYETLATGTLADQRFIGIYGVKVNEDIPCTALKFNVGNSDKLIWQLQSLSKEDGFVGICPTGVIIPADAPYTISRYVRIVSSPAVIVLKGVVVEPRGKVLSP